MLQSASGSRSSDIELVSLKGQGTRRTEPTPDGERHIQFAKGNEACMEGKFQDAIGYYGALSHEPQAVNNAGVAHHHLRNYAEAAEKFALARAAGNRLAGNNLGVMYQYGHGVPKDLERAKELYEESRTPPAKKNLEVMEADQRSKTSSWLPWQKKPEVQVHQVYFALHASLSAK